MLFFQPITVVTVISCITQCKGTEIEKCLRSFLKKCLFQYNKKLKAYAFFACLLVDLTVSVSVPDQRSNENIEKCYLETYNT